MNVEYVGPEHFKDAEPGRDPAPDYQVATNLVHWIESGFPEDVTLVGTRKRMRTADLLTAAFDWGLAVPLPMPGHLAASVCEYLSVEEDERVARAGKNWLWSIFKLRDAVSEATPA